MNRLCCGTMTCLTKKIVQLVGIVSEDKDNKRRIEHCSQPLEQNRRVKLI
jgi:hypothetical protein